ncbi:hypothetical protein CERZMDRAFT_98813 [Cercospora zeae-maydis SCOH1-5]|uniref:Uncharacterized protein n=1 Tax=Cercospora zeae-maydis SCOH1-5 TaxID=717836 RepID=A0A6A6FCG2_9PEZI|nr:hypothetical protein CERZMDRAFT_98813 [Cercospora zeae-maydis SCOH1-5]
MAVDTASLDRLGRWSSARAADMLQTAESATAGMQVIGQLQLCIWWNSYGRLLTEQDGLVSANGHATGLQENGRTIVLQDEVVAWRRRNGCIGLWLGRANAEP